MEKMRKLIQKVFLFIDNLGIAISEKKLIVFDRKVVCLLLFSVISLVILTTFKINYSSVSCWNKAFPNEKSQEASAPLLGTPKEIRSDEYRVVTPFMLSQAKQNPPFPVSNESLGDKKTPLLMSLPVSHFSTLFRPQNWGFFILDLERAYAFYWNFKVIGLILSFFLLMMLLTKNNFWVSLLSSFWLFFSSYIQWWFSTPAMLPEMITSGSLVFLGFAYLLFSEKKKSIFIGSLLMLVFGINFVLFFYPPFQITLVYLYLFLFGGYFWKNFDKKSFSQLKIIRLVSFLFFSVLFLAVLFEFYQEAKETIAVMMQTVYPGKRTLTGGGIDFSRIFSGYFDPFWNDKSFPKKMGFEGNFALFFPFVFLVMLWRIIQKKGDFKKEVDKYFLGLYIGLTLIWILVGFPTILAKIFLLDMIHPMRIFLGLGIANIILTAIFLAETPEIKSEKKLFSLKNLGFFLILLALIFLVGRYFVESRFSWFYIICLSSAMALLALMVILKRWKLFFIPLIALIALPNFPVNPIVYGLDSINKKEIVVFIEDQELNKMHGKWVIFGEHFVANLVKTTGVDVVNGVNFLPEFEKNKIIDSENKYQDIYNRYANIGYSFSEDDAPVYTLDYLDHYTIDINPCSERIRNIGVRYIVLPKKYKEPECLLRITDKSLNKMHIYTYKD